MQPEFQSKALHGQTFRFWDAGRGPAVLLFHGFPDSPRSYVTIARALNEAGYRTVVPYLRGYHADTLVPGRRYDGVSIGEDAIRLMDALELESATLIGHDWGASVVYAATALAPERVEAAVPIGVPHPITLAPKSFAQGLALAVLARHFLYFRMPWAEAGTRRNDFAYLDALYSRWAPDWRSEERDAALAAVKECFADPQLLRAALQYYRDVPHTQGHRLKPPLRKRALLVAGGRDFGGHLGPYRRTQDLFEPRAELLVLPEAGHWPHREQEAAFTRELLGFLAQKP